MTDEVSITYGTVDDEKYLVQWLQEPGVLKWFPMCNLVEIKDAAKLWASYAKQNALLRAEIHGEPVGIANLYLQPYKKFAHHALFAIIVTEKHRNKGIGSKLLEALETLAKEKFNLEILHLEVYEKNPAKALYERLGFKQFGYQPKFIKEEDGHYLGKYFLQKKL